MIEVDPRAVHPRDMAKLLSAAVVPRPVALVTTIGAGGPNAAPFSFFNLVCSDPPMLMVSMSAREGGAPKDTARNIERLPEFVVHIVDEPSAQKMNACSAELPYGVNEIERAGFRTLPSVKVRPPRLAECPVHLECRVERILKLGRRPNTMVIGEVVFAHFREGLVDTARWRLDVAALGAFGRMENDHYARLTDRFHMPRPEMTA